MENVLSSSNRARLVPILCAVRRGIGVAVLVLSMLLACSDPKAGTLPSASPSTHPSLSTPPTSSTPPDPRTELRNALQTYFDALYAAGVDPATKTDALAALIEPTCTCYQVVNVLRDEARQGRYIDYRYSLSDVKVVDVDSRGGHINYTVARSEGAERDRAGRVIERFEAITEKYSAHFARSNATLLLDRLTRFT